MGEKSAVIVLGNGIGQDGKLPTHVIAGLVEIAKDHKEDTSTIILSGKWSINYTRQREEPNATEARLMKEVLIQNNIDPNRIILEEESQDTIGNALWTREIVNQKGFTHITVKGWQHNAKRAEMIFRQVYANIPFTFDAQPSPWDKEDNTLFIEQEAFLAQILRKEIPPSQLYDQEYYHKSPSQEDMEVSLAAMGWGKEKAA